MVDSKVQNFTRFPHDRMSYLGHKSMFSNDYIAMLPIIITFFMAIALLKRWSSSFQV